MKIDLLPLEIPKLIYDLDGGCGPVSAWMVLNYFKKLASPSSIIKACRHSKKNGTFMICLALALRKYGLQVSFYTEPDVSPHHWEKQSYRAAESKGVILNDATSIQSLLARVNKDCLALVLYDLANGEAHISPLIGKKGRGLLLPYAEGGELSVENFKKGWNAPDILCQCILVSS
ncbi:MAG: hypothetical protein L3J39_09050 [Verrucomicrobiales bacterium]|nr:hypothetical protein [Verrucomicrobiales bacterium]